MLTLLAVALLQAGPPPGSPPEEIPVEATYKDNLKFRTKGGEYDGYLAGFLRLQGRTIFDRPDDDVAPLRSLPDTVFLRQARFDHGATLYQDWAYRIVFDFSTGNFNQSTGEDPSGNKLGLRDAWVEWKRFREFTIRLGQFFEPCSAEEISGARLLEFVDRSPMNRISPGRDLGIEAYGTLLDDRLSYFVMASHGGALLQDAGRSNADANDQKELAGLLYVRPIPEIRLGLGGTIGTVDDVPVSDPDTLDFDLVTTELSVLYLDSTTGAFDGRRWRADASILGAYGPASLRAEILLRKDDLAPGLGEGSIRCRGWYVAATTYLTGEEKKPDTRVTPLHEWGAIELSARVGQLRALNAFEAGIAPRAGNAEAATAYSLAVSWWHARFFRVTLEGVREVYSDPLQFDNVERRVLTGVMVRVQLDF